MQSFNEQGFFILDKDTGCNLLQRSIIAILYPRMSKTDYL